jgi:hypothetical protein
MSNPTSYPTWVYRAWKSDDGRIHEDGVIVIDDREWDEARRQGFVYGGPQAAKDVLEACEQAVAQAAAETAHSAQKMSKKAQAEFDRREAAIDKHVTE